jgi:hypothetical protein
VADLNQNLVALLGAAVGTSVFTIGFLTNRSHAALRDAKQHLLLPAPEDRPSTDWATERDNHAKEMLNDARTPLRLRSWDMPLVVFANAVLAFLVVVVFIVALSIDRRSWEDAVTLIGFVVVEVAVLLMGWIDDAHVSRTLASARRDRSR